MEHALLLSCSAAMGIKVLYCLSMAGWKVSIALDQPFSPLRRSRHVAGTLELSNLSQTPSGTLAAAIDDYCRTRNISVILADAIAAAGRLNELQPLLRTPSYAPEPPHRLAHIHDKWLFYQTLKDSFPMPRTVLFNDPSDLNERSVEWVGRPFILKPLNGESGHGIRRFDTCRDALAYQGTPGKYRTLPLLIQQYIPGSDFGYSVISDKGKVIIDDIQYRDENDVRRFCTNDAIRSLCREIIAKLNYSGPAFIDLRQDQDTGQFYPLECNCRFWSTMTANAWVGINYADIAAQITLGGNLNLETSQQSTYYLPGTIMRYFIRPQNLLKVSKPNWLGFLQAVGDPFPHVINILRPNG